jgi:hypothetical protein
VDISDQRRYLFLGYLKPTVAGKFITIEAIAKPFVIPECLYREYGFSSS